MKADELIDSLKEFNPLSDYSREQIIEGEFIVDTLEEMENLEQIKNLADREEEMAGIMDHSSDVLDELIRISREDEIPEGHLKHVREQLEDLNENLRTLRKSFDTEEGQHLIRPLELSVDLEIAIEDVEHLIEMPEDRLEEIMEPVKKSEVFKENQERLEDLRDELTKLESRTLDAADSISPRDIELKINRAERKLEEKRRNLSGEQSREAAGIIESLDELKELIPDTKEPRGAWIEFLEYIGLRDNRYIEGVEEITASDRLLEDPDAYERILNSLRMVIEDDKLEDISILREFSREEDGYIDYSHSKVKLRVELDGDPNERLDEICYAVFREPSEISEVNIRGSHVIHVDGDTSERIRSVLQDLETFENELKDIREILEKDALR